MARLGLDRSGSTGGARIETLVQLATSESTIQESADVGDYRLMGIHVTKLPHQPRRARGALSDPTPKASLLKSTGHIDLQAVVCRWYEIACFIMDQRPRQICPLVFPLHALE